ncbi:MAG: linked oxidase domain protein, partial [Solirubrobacterales bacterium]|nr:linked oxidase domain protein [Solirubrobacterales bacterium]
HWGWGFEDEQQTSDNLRAMAPLLREQLGFEPQDVEEPVPLAAVTLPEPRIVPPAALADICDTSTHERATHAQGKALADIVGALRGSFPHPPDVVARPREEREIEAVLEWAAAAGARVIPYGGGTSVVGGVEARFDEPAISLDLGLLNALHELDPVSRSARIGAGAAGPRIERRLAEHGMTMRFFPQSFEHSTLGGWVATRAGGHFATLWTHIDDLVESVRAVTPTGLWQSRRLPGSGAGVSPDRMLLGSEGILGVITEAWVRVQPKPVHRLSVPVRFERFADGAEAVRAIVQARLHPSNCRLIDPQEARFTGANPDPARPAALLVLGFEGVDEDPAPVEAAMARARALCAAHGGEPGESKASGDWKDTFLRAPHLRDMLLQLGVVAETFETAITWERFADFHATVTAAARDALGGPGLVTCRFTHAYQDGPAPYFTVIFPARRGEEVEQWWAVKRAASDAISAAGGTITHHHAVGRDHRPWYDQQRPEPFAAALRAAKAAVDPAGVLNPGVLV